MMFSFKGKVRYSGIRILIQSNNMRFNSTSSLSYKSNNTDYADKIISLVKTPDDFRKELDQFINSNLSNFKELNVSNPSLVNQRIIKRNIQYNSITNLNEILNDNQVKKALELVKSNYRQGNYLSFIEFQNLFIQFLPFNWYAYYLLKLYETRYDLTKCNAKMLVLIMKVSFSNFDYKLFHKLFKFYQSKNEKIPVDILMSAIQVYLKTENIQIATQLFNQQVMTEPSLPARILDLFISNLYNKTKNVKLCFSSYRLWLSKNLSTNISIDSFMYNLLLESNHSEEIEWIEKSLKERKLFDKFAIQFGNLCNDLSKSYQNYNNFINSKDLIYFTNLAKRDNELSSLLNNLTYLHLRHRNYDLALDTFRRVDNKKDFQLTIFSILRHFEKEEKPDIIFKILKNLKNDSNYRIHWSQILIYWRSIIKKYPHLGFEIEKKFQKSLKKSKYHRFGFLSKMLLVKKQSINGQTFEIRYYPIVKYANLDYDLKPLPASPKLKNIESRLLAGILPNSELLRKSIRLTNDEVEFNRLVEISNKLEFNRNIKLNVEIFYKSCSFGIKLSIEEFINNQIEIINQLKFIDDQDLCELFKIAVKTELNDECMKILQLFEKFNVKIIGDQQILKFLSMFIKWCWLNQNFKDLLLTLNWLEKQTEFTTDKFFYSNLKDAAYKNLNKIENSDINSLNESGKDFINNILPKIMNYYDTTLEKINDKNSEKNKLIIDESYNCFSQLMKWVDEDTETMFEGDW